MTTNELREAAQRSAILEAVARGWCHPTTSDIEMDSRLAEAITDEVLAALTATTNEAAAQADGRTLSAADLERVRQWYCSMVDVSPQYAEKADHELAARIYADLGMRVPHSLRDAALATQPVQAQGDNT